MNTDSSVEKIAAILNCPAEKMRANLRNCGKQLRVMERQARKSGKKVRGYTADQLAERAASYEERSAVDQTQLTCKIVDSDLGDSPAVPIKTLNDASAKYRAFIEENFLGASEAGQCFVYRGTEIVARVSYNGTVWEEPNHRAEPLFEP